VARAGKAAGASGMTRRQPDEAKVGVATSRGRASPRSRWRDAIKVADDAENAAYVDPRRSVLHV